MTLATDLSEAEARVAQLKRSIAGAGCAEAGHEWKFSGGKNAGCSLDRDCRCSVPVHVCAKCGDSDYGDNVEADTIRTDCFDKRDEDTCRECGAVEGTPEYGTMGDGFDGLCPNCADRADPDLDGAGVAMEIDGAFA